MDMSKTTLIPRVSQTQKAVIPRQVVITQTIVNEDFTTTALVTLGPGSPSSAPSAPSPQSSPGLSSSDVGIIIGSIVGVVAAALFIWMGCVIRRRMIKQHMYEHENKDRLVAYETVQAPERTYWPQFPFSIPPPAVPTYQATEPQPMYTANRAGRRGATSFVYYDTRGRRR